MFTAANNWKQMSMSEWINKCGPTNGTLFIILIHAATWMNLKIILLSENKIQEYIMYSPFLWNSKKCKLRLSGTTPQWLEPLQREWGMMGMFCTLIVRAVISWGGVYVKIHSVIHFNVVHYMWTKPQQSWYLKTLWKLCQ